MCIAARKGRRVASRADQRTQRTGIQPTERKRRSLCPPSGLGGAARPESLRLRLSRLGAEKEADAAPPGAGSPIRSTASTKSTYLEKFV